jgi:hypothetical protein
MSKSGYNFISRSLHRVALQSKAMAEISFDIENAIINKKGRYFPDNHVFISGLARSGTTILMRYLHQTGHFRSLTYLDMPFVLMPNIWKRISYRKTAVEYHERAHRDGIMVGFDSPEALEEVFWRVFCGKDYILEDRLQLHRVEDNVLAKFKDYVNNILISSGEANQTRYLSKNNNHVLRLDYLQKIMPGSHIIIPFREPLQHSNSLLNQHIHFSKMQQEDSFSLDYMNWLGHFEFGLNQKSFFLEDDTIFREMGNYPKTDINFWLLNWKNYYSYVNEHYTQNTIFFNFDKFCQDPDLELSRLFEKLNIISPRIRPESFQPPVKIIKGFDGKLLEECNSIYKMLEIKSDL